MTKPQLLAHLRQILLAARITPRQGMATGEVKNAPVIAEEWAEGCRRMERECPMETTLEGDAWCDLREKDVIFMPPHYYQLTDIFSILHTEFTAMDMSYEIPPLRLQIPRDSFTRAPFSLDFFLRFKEAIKKARIVPPTTSPEVAYFLRHVKEFYTDPTLQPFLRASNPSLNKVEMSRAIENFMTRGHEIEHRSNPMNRQLRWVWVNRRKTQTELRRYLHGS